MAGPVGSGAPAGSVCPWGARRACSSQCRKADGGNPAANVEFHQAAIDRFRWPTPRSIA